MSRTLPAIGSLSLEARIGKLLFLPVRGLVCPAGLADAAARWRRLAALGPGGAIFFGADAALAHRFLSDLRASGSCPLLTAADLERGADQQFAGATAFPSPMALAATGDADLVRRVAAATAREARAIGVGQIYAPVADVNVAPENPIIATRAFGDDPDRVAALVAAAVRGIEDEGLVATAKHFPGHGATRADSHLELPTDDRDAEALRRTNLPPFRAAFEAGARSAMVAHVAYPALSGAPGLASTLCPAISGTLLRDELGFDGFAVTDAFNMGAIAAVGEVEAACRALEAGLDAILHPEDPEALVAGLAAAVRAGRLDPARIARSVERLFAILATLPGPESLAVLGGTEARQLAREATARSLTWLQRGRDALPLSPAPTALDLFLVHDPDLAAVADAFAAAASRRVPDLEVVRGVDGGRAGRPGLVAIFSAIRGFKGTSGPAGVSMESLSRLTSDPGRARVVLCGSPYLAASLDPEASVLLAYDPAPLAAELAAEAAFGERDAPGICPVRIR